MTDDVAFVACASLAPVIEEVAPGIEAAYLPHELHESPLDPGCDDAVASAVQDAVDRLAGSSLAYVAVAYARSSPGLCSVTAPEVPLAVWRHGDCTDALCDRPVGRWGESRASDAYYLTPGAIETGLDPYKLYLAYAGRTDALVADQRAAGLAVAWHRGDRLAAVVDGGPRPDPSLLRRQFAVQCAAYRRVVLLDTGRVTPAHRRYGRRLAGFLEGLGGEDGAVTLEVEPADLDPIRALVAGDALDDDRVDVVPPTRRIPPLDRQVDPRHAPEPTPIQQS